MVQCVDYCIEYEMCWSGGGERLLLSSVTQNCFHTQNAGKEKKFHTVKAHFKAVCLQLCVSVQTVCLKVGC